MIGESTDFTSQAVAFGYLGLAFGVGTVLGEQSSFTFSLLLTQDKHGNKYAACFRNESAASLMATGVFAQGHWWAERCQCPVRMLGLGFPCAAKAT